MTSDTGGLVSLILGVLTLISVVASAVAVARAALAKSTIETLQDSNAALSERVGLLEKEDARHQSRVLALEAENKVLRGIAGGTEAVERLGVQMAVQYEHLMEALAALKAQR